MLRIQQTNVAYLYVAYCVLICLQFWIGYFQKDFDLIVYFRFLRAFTDNFLV